MAATLVQQKINNSIGVNPATLTFDSAVTAGNLIVVFYYGTIGAFGTTCTDNIGNTYTLARDEHQGFNESLSMFYTYNSAGGTPTISCGGIASSSGISMFEFSGVDSGADPLMDSGGAQGTGTTLQDSLVFGDDALLLAGFYNETSDNETGLVGVDTVANHSSSGNRDVEAYKLSQTATTMNVGFTCSSSSDNVVAVAAFKLAAVAPANATITGLSTITGISTLTA